MQLQINTICNYNISKHFYRISLGIGLQWSIVAYRYTLNSPLYPTCSTFQLQQLSPPLVRSMTVLIIYCPHYLFSSPWNWIIKTFHGRIKKKKLHNFSRYSCSAKCANLIFSMEYFLFFPRLFRLHSRNSYYTRFIIWIRTILYKLLCNFILFAHRAIIFDQYSNANSFHSN